MIILGLWDEFDDDGTSSTTPHGYTSSTPCSR
jgi:hypothetical protein